MTYNPTAARKFIEDIAQSGIHVKTFESDQKLMTQTQFLAAVDEHFKACAKELLK